MVRVTVVWIASIGVVLIARSRVAVIVAVTVTVVAIVAIAVVVAGVLIAVPLVPRVGVTSSPPRVT